MKPNNGDQAEDPANAASDHSLLKQYRSGDQQAAMQLYLRYAHRLRGLAKTQLSDELAGKVEVDDIVQSVFGSFFRGVNNALYDVPLGEELWRLLLVIALHKIRNHGTYHQADKRDIRRTTQLDEAEHAPVSRADEDQAATMFLRMVIDEALERMSPQHKEMVELRMEGYSVPEIAEKTGRSKRSVERLLQQARTKLSGILEAGE